MTPKVGHASRCIVIYSGMLLPLSIFRINTAALSEPNESWAIALLHRAVAQTYEYQNRSDCFLLVECRLTGIIVLSRNLLALRLS